MLIFESGIKGRFLSTTKLNLFIFQENKDPANTEIKRKKTKIIKRMVKKRKPSRKLKPENDSNKELSRRSGPESYKNSENGSSIERRLSPKR